MGRISDIIKSNMKLDVDKTKRVLTDREREYWKEVKKENPRPADCFSYENVKRGFKFYANSSITNYKFNYDDENKNVIKLLCIYFSKDDNMMIKNFPQYSTRKGLLIAGNCGTGKTLIIKIFKEIVKNLTSQAFKMTSTNEVVRNYDENGSKALKMYISSRFVFDDFGSENMGKHYGKDEEVFKTIIEERYNKYIESGLTTYLTTNLTITQIKNRYGDRVASRINEMFNVILLGGHDRRK